MQEAKVVLELLVLLPLFIRTHLAAEAAEQEKLVNQIVVKLVLRQQEEEAETDCQVRCQVLL
jgi:hypothetical protein